MNALRTPVEITAKLPRAIQLRIFMYILTIVLHITNFSVTAVWILRVTDDPVVKFYLPFWPRLFTVWTLVMHMIHSAVGLYCDKHTLDHASGRDQRIESLRSFNNTYFCCLVWPSTWTGSFIFWFFYNYDGNLVKIEMINKVSNTLTNHIGHTFPVFTVLWEAFFQQRSEPKSHKRNVLLVLSTVAVYLSMLWYTYVTSGTWVYPFYDESYGTIYFLLIHLATCLFAVGAYYAQWSISRVTDLSTTSGKQK